MAAEQQVRLADIELSAKQGLLSFFCLLKDSLLLAYATMAYKKIR